MTTAPSPHRPSDLLAALTTSVVTLGCALATAVTLKSIFPHYGRFAFFGPVDGLLLWLLLGLVAWALAFLGVERQRDRLAVAGADAPGLLERRGRALRASAGHLVAFLGVHALVYVGALAALVLHFREPAPALYGLCMGVGILPLSLVAPWAAALGLVSQQRAEMDPVSATVAGWFRVVCSPLRVLAGLIPNLLILAVLGGVVFQLLAHGGDRVIPLEFAALLVLSPGATHLQVALGRLAEKEGLFRPRS